MSARHTRDARAKVLCCGVTALLMLPSAPVAAASPPTPLRVDGAGALGCRVDPPALSRSAGIALRPAGPDERAWRAEVRRGGDLLHVRVRRPDGTVATQRATSAAPDVCAALSELLSILLAAHVPEVRLSLPQPALPASTPRPPPRPRFRVALAGGVSGFAEGPALLAGVTGNLQLWRGLAAGGQLGFTHQRRSVPRTPAASASVWGFDARGTAGYLHRGARVSFMAGGLVGLRLPRGSAAGLDENGAATVPAALLGLFVDHWWSLGRGWSVGAGTAVLWSLPRAGFTVDNRGTVYESPAPTVELQLSVGWGA